MRHNSHFLGHTRQAPILGYQLPLVGLRFGELRATLEPHPPRPVRKLQHPGVGPTLGFPNRFARFHRTLDAVEIVVKHPSVAAVVNHSLGICDSHFDGQLLASLGISVCRSNAAASADQTKASLRSLPRPVESAFCGRQTPPDPGKTVCSLFSTTFLSQPSFCRTLGE